MAGSGQVGTPGSREAADRKYSVYVFPLPPTHILSPPMPFKDLHSPAGDDSISSVTLLIL